jgi:hypothetical protein
MVTEFSVGDVLQALKAIEEELETSYENFSAATIYRVTLLRISKGSGEAAKLAQAAMEEVDARVKGESR